MLDYVIYKREKVLQGVKEKRKKHTLRLIFPDLVNRLTNPLTVMVHLIVTIQLMQKKKKKESHSESFIFSSHLFYSLDISRDSSTEVFCYDCLCMGTCMRREDFFLSMLSDKSQCIPFKFNIR